MIKSKNFLVSLLVFLISFNTTIAQDLVVNGVVSSSEDNSPIPGVSVVVKGTTNGTTTDFDGKYSLKVNTNDELIFSYLGYENITIVVDRSKIDVQLSVSVDNLEEVVIIGYGAVKKKEVTGAVAQLSADNIESISTTDLGTALQGQVAGVNIISSDQPGGDSEILIRGITSLNDNSPLYVVDGITSTDTRVLQSFNAQSVRMHFDGTAINNEVFASFEQENTAWNRAFAGSDYFVGGRNDDFGGYVWQRVTDKAYHESASMKYETPASTPIPNNVNLFGFGIAKPTGISRGTYRVHYWVYIEPTTTLKAFRVELGNPNKGQATYTMPPFDISNAPKGEWTRVSSTVTIDADMTDLTYRSTLRFYAADNPGVTGAQKMYFDDLSMIELEIRN